jgi:uncharacterized protein (TIGR02246 family)
MQTAMAQKLSMSSAPAAAVRKAGSRRSLVRVAPTTRCQAIAAKADEAVTIRFDAAGKPVVSLGPGAPAPTSEKAELAQIASLFDLWNSTLQTGEPEKVASLYAPDGILLPTVSNKVRTDHAGKVDYFTAFLQLKPFGVIDQSIVRFLTPEKDVASNSGIYTFTLQKPEGPVKVQARYSFVYRLIDGEWKITEHHSSAMPEPVVDPLEEVAALFDLWNTTLQTGDPEKVASLYAPDGVLLPTVSNKVRPDHASKVDYFTAFLQLKPFGTINESHVRFLNTQKTLAANSGVYTFQLQKPDGPASVQARYSYIYRKVDGVWKIAEHHSSAMPEPVAAPAAAAVEAVAA